MTDERIMQILCKRFDYTIDNNRDLITDASFPFDDAMQEIQVRAAYETLVAYLARQE